ncbi:MAG: putative glycoside hydrolase [Patescibacteria group bacterium]|jgi:hypothetical protein
MRSDIGAFRARGIITRVVVIFVLSAAVSTAVFYLWKDGKLAPETQATDSYLNIVQPYVGSEIVAHSDATEDSLYEWSLNSEVAENGTVPTTFLAHFDDSQATVTGENPVSSGSVTYENGKFGKGMVGSAEYSLSNNIDFSEGTMDIWLTLKKPLTDPVFDTSPYIFRYHNNSTGDSFMMNVHEINVLKFTMYDYADGWELSAQGGNDRVVMPTGIPVLLTATWSASGKVIKYYYNGEQVYRRDYTEGENFPSIVPGSENIVVGNNNVIVDELRFLNAPLSSDQIHEYYKRSVPFSESDIYYDGDLVLGDEIGLTVTGGGDALSSSATVLDHKISVTSPDGYFIPNTEQFTISFTTPSPMTCRYGVRPEQYSVLANSTGPAGTEHSITQTVDDIIDQFPVAIKCQGTSDDPDDYGFFRQFRVLPDIPQTYPKISELWWGNLPTTSEVEYLSRYDMVNFSKAAIGVPDVIRQIKEANPNAAVLLYKDAIGYQDYSGVAFKTFNDRLNPSLRLQSSESPGTYCYNPSFPSNLIYNLNVISPYTDISAEHMEKDIFDRLNYFDGIWWDVVGPSFWFLYDYVENPGVYEQYCDFDFDGIDEDLNNSADLDKATQIWNEGMHAQMQKNRERLGQDMLTVGNGNAVYHGDYNGNLWERVFQPSTLTYYFDPANTRGFEYWEENSLAPHLNDNLFENANLQGSTSYYRYHRYGLAASLMTGIYYNPQSPDGNRSQSWFDEYWVDFETGQPTDDYAVGRGYLGLPTTDYAQVQSGIYRRDFENGIVLLNNTIATSTVNLGGTYRYIDATEGGQDPAANPGGETDSVTLSMYDGRILLNPLPPVDSTPPGTISDLIAY